MNIFAQLFTEKLVTTVADEGVGGLREITSKFAGNYIKRRNVGFEVIPSLAGSFNETKKYYCDILTGKDPVETKEAIFYVNNN